MVFRAASLEKFPKMFLFSFEAHRYCDFLEVHSLKILISLWYLGIYMINGVCHKNKGAVDKFTWGCQKKINMAMNLIFTSP